MKKTRMPPAHATNLVANSGVANSGNALYRGLGYLLVPGRYGCNFKDAAYNLVLVIGIFKSFHVNALRSMPRDIADKQTLVR